MRIIESWLMVDQVEDWSAVRSPARARRRLKRGFPQRIVVREYQGEYRMAVVEILSIKPGAPVKEYLPWFADDVICELRANTSGDHNSDQ